MSHRHDDGNYSDSSVAGLRDHLRREHAEVPLSLHDLQWGPRIRLESMHRELHPDAPQFEPSVALRIYPGSISVPEFRALRDAADEAKNKGTITWLRYPSGDPVAAVVPVQVARQFVTDDGAVRIARDSVIRVTAGGRTDEYLVRSVMHAGLWELVLGVVPNPEDGLPPDAKPSKSLTKAVIEHLSNYQEGAYGPSAHDLSLIFCATERQVQATLDHMDANGWVTSRHIHDYTMEPARWELTEHGRFLALLEPLPAREVPGE